MPCNAMQCKTCTAEQCDSWSRLDTCVPPVRIHAGHYVTADQDKKVRLLEVSKAKSSPFGLLSALAVGGVMHMARGEQSSLQSLATTLLAGQLQKAAFQNGVTPNGATMAIMPDIQVKIVCM